MEAEIIDNEMEDLEEVIKILTDKIIIIIIIQVEQL